MNGKARICRGSIGSKSDLCEGGVGSPLFLDCLSMRGKPSTCKVARLQDGNHLVYLVIPDVKQALGASDLNRRGSDERPLPSEKTHRKEIERNMASVEKFTDSAVIKQIRHNHRTILNDKNLDIDPARTHLNCTLTPDRGMSEYEYYQKRKKELYCYKRQDIKTLAGWIVTAPAELNTKEEIREFFEQTSNFLQARYGKENTISITCHFDEGKMEKVKDRWGGYVKDENGNIKKKIVLGRPHMHFLFIPVAEDNTHKQGQKICAKEVLTRTDMRSFHTDLQSYLEERHCPGADGVITGKTKAQGRNYTVEELKERYEMEKEIERLRKIEYDFNHQHTIERGSSW